MVVDAAVAAAVNDIDDTGEHSFRRVDKPRYQPQRGRLAERRVGFRS